MYGGGRAYIRTYMHTNKQSQWRHLLARKKKCHFTFEKTVSGVTRNNEEAISYTYIRTFLPPLTHSFIRIHTYILNIILFMHIKLLSFFICFDAWCMYGCMYACLCSSNLVRPILDYTYTTATYKYLYTFMQSLIRPFAYIHTPTYTSHKYSY